MEMTEMTFSLMDVIEIGGGIASLLAFYFALKYAVQKNKESIEALTTLFENKIEEMKKSHEKEMETVHNRITKTQNEQKEYQSKIDDELKEVNKSISDVNVGVSEIKGMLKEALNKN